MVLTNDSDSGRKLDLRNKYIMAPIKTGYSDGSGVITDAHLRFYAERAEYVGAIIPEPLYLDKGLREIPTQIGIDSDDKIEGLKKLTETIHSKGAKVIAHLNHPGRMANPKIPGNYFVSSTDKACENGGATPKAMDRSDMDKVIELFKAAAIRAEKAGFDIIELQMGHGYLLAQFISPAVNTRTDEYGGSFENRIKFPLEVLDALLETVKLPIIVRISGDEMIPDGFKIDDMIKLSEVLKEKGVSAIHVTAGSVCSTPPWFFQHMFIPKGKTWQMASSIKEKVDIPIIFVGRINTLEDLQVIENEYHADYIALGRSLVADPQFLGKALGNVSGTIMPCLACAKGCLGGVKSGKGLQCLVNPRVRKELPEVKPVEKKKNIAIVGGGLAGMEAAIILTERGHNVKIFEKDRLGGQFKYAPLTPEKKSLHKLIPAFTHRIEELKIPVEYKEATEEDLVGKFDEVILATGGEPRIIPFPGLEKYYWAEILLPENMPTGKHVAIIGGGLIGVDVALALIAHNNRVSIIEILPEIGGNMEAIAKKLSLHTLQQKQAVLSPNTKVVKIEGNKIYAEENGMEVVFDNVDIIVVATGMRPYRPLEEKLKGKIPYYLIGDAKAIGDAQTAIRDAYDLAITL